jgi:hypothetical protein
MVEFGGAVSSGITDAGAVWEAAVAAESTLARASVAIAAVIRTLRIALLTVSSGTTSTA